MVYLECPLCCAEHFPDEHSLKNHLLNISDNIVCPICELQFKTVRSLAIHLVDECNKSEELAMNDNSKDISLELNPVYAITNSINEKIQSRNADTLLCDNITEALESNDENSLLASARNCTLGEEVLSSDRLYTCSVCNTTFTSVEDHLREFHQDEHVVVDSHENQDYKSLLDDVENSSEAAAKVIQKELEDIGYHISESEAMVEDFLPAESSPVIWSSDEMKNDDTDNFIQSKIMFLLEMGNKDLEEDSLESPNLQPDNKSQCKQTSFVLSSTSVTKEGRWVFSIEGYYYASDDTKEHELRERSKRATTLASAIAKITNDELSSSSSLDQLILIPDKTKKLPLATFVTVFNEFNENDLDPIERVPLQEYKQYVYRGHRVRLVTVKGGSNGLPTMEEIPFPDKPPDTVIPFLEPAVDTPTDLQGTFAVMWPCNYCGYLDLHWSNLAKHQCSMLSESGANVCMFCSKEFQTKRSLTNHCNLAHRKQPLGKYKCPHCTASITNLSHLTKHLAMHKKNDLLKCNQCNNMVPKSTYDQHVQAHQENGSLHLVCILCNRPFKGKEELDLHIPQCHLQDTPTNFLQCTFCQNTFLDLGSLRRHLVSHNIPIRPHGCSFCAKSFFRLIDKVVHERVHTKSKPHECKECGRCFRLRHSLITHRRIHTGERPYPCSECQKSFRTKHLLRAHLHTHSEQMEIQCSFCPKMFKCKERARIHENKHKTIFTCDECGRTFHSFSFMKKHMDNHKAGKLLYTCSMCLNMFTRAAYLEKHLEAVHGLDSATSISISVQKTYEQMNKMAKESLVQLPA